MNTMIAYDYLDAENEELFEFEETEEIANYDSTLDLYLNEVQRYPLITPERELLLGRRIKKGRELMIELVMSCPSKSKSLKQLCDDVVAWRDKKIRPNISHSEAVAMMRDRMKEIVKNNPNNSMLGNLSRRLTRLDRMIRNAMDELVTANLRLVVNVAKGFINRGLAVEDLVQEGNLGLIKAAERFDYSTGFRFCTYGIWWIKQAMIRAIYDKARTIRLPVHLLETRSAYYRAYYKLMKEMGREPENYEIAEEMDVDIEKVDILMQSIKDPLSIDAPKGDDDTKLGDILEASNYESPLETISYFELCQVVRESLNNLPVREERVLGERYGLSSETKTTLDQLGKELNISRERVRQLEIQGLNRLRQPDSMQVLRSLV